MKTLAKGYIDVSLVILIWSGFILVSRMGGKSELLPYDVVALRFSVAALLLLPVWIVSNRVNLLNPKILGLGLTGGIGYAVLVYLGFKYSTATHASILMAGMLPFEITVFAWLLEGEKPSRWRIKGLALIAAGVMCLALEKFNNGFSGWAGDIAFLGASMCWALYTVLVRRWKIGVWDATIGNALVSASIYLPVYVFLLPKHMALASWGTIATQAFYQGIVVVIIAMFLYIRAVTLLGASRMGVCMALVPAISGCAAIPLLHEPVTPYIVAGLALTSAGAWLGNRIKIPRLRHPGLPDNTQ